jgi:hypothetical protein
MSGCSDGITPTTTPTTDAVLMIGTPELLELAEMAKKLKSSEPYGSWEKVEELLRLLAAGAGKVKAEDLCAALGLLGMWFADEASPPQTDPRARFRSAAKLIREAYSGLDLTSGVAADAASLWDAAVQSAPQKDQRSLLLDVARLRTRRPTPTV